MELPETALLQKYDQVYENDHGIPLYVFNRVKHFMWTIRIRLSFLNDPYIL